MSNDLAGGPAVEGPLAPAEHWGKLSQRILIPGGIRQQYSCRGGVQNPWVACTGFEWDDANAPKNRELHRAAPEETEDLFFNDPLIVRSDIRHAKQRKRHYSLGQTGGKRKSHALIETKGRS